MRERREWDWVEFRQLAARKEHEALFVRLSPTHGEFYMNIATWKRLGSPAAFVLLFDPKTETIGLRPSTVDVPHAVIVRTFTGKRYKVIRALPFIHEHRLYVARTVHFPTAYVDKNGILCLNMLERVLANRKFRQAKQVQKLIRNANHRLSDEFAPELMDDPEPASATATIPQPPHRAEPGAIRRS